MKEVNVDVHIRKNKTGEIRTRKDTLLCDDDGISTFIWGEGNYSCDCNRGIFFARVNGEEEDEDIKCGSSKYSVNIELDGEMIYSEFETGAED